MYLAKNSLAPRAERYISSVYFYQINELRDIRVDESYMIIASKLVTVYSVKCRQS